MADDAEQLDHHHANHLRALRHFDAEQRFDGQAIGQVVRDAAQVVDAVGIGQVSIVGLAFGDFFLAAVVITDVDVHVVDGLAVEPHRDLDHAVRAGMVRADLQQHRAVF